MKRNNKKGFTIVELVIVIAVIAILAGVLIPTFAGIVKKANNSSIQQETRAALTVILAEENGQLDSAADYYFYYNSKDGVSYFKYNKTTAKLEEVKDTAANISNNKIILNDNDVVWSSGDATTLTAVGVDTTAAASILKTLEDLENVVVVKSVSGGNNFTAANPTT